MYHAENHRKIPIKITIDVPDNEYCWNGQNVCYYFDNVGGRTSCELGFRIHGYDSEGKVRKSNECWHGWKAEQ